MQARGCSPMAVARAHSLLRAAVTPLLRSPTIAARRALSRAPLRLLATGPGGGSRDIDTSHPAHDMLAALRQSAAAGSSEAPQHSTPHAQPRPGQQATHAAAAAGSGYTRTGSPELPLPVGTAKAVRASDAGRSSGLQPTWPGHEGSALHGAQEEGVQEGVGAAGEQQAAERARQAEAAQEAAQQGEQQGGQRGQRELGERQGLGSTYGADTL